MFLQHKVLQNSNQSPSCISLPYNHHNELSPLELSTFSVQKVLGFLGFL